MLARNTFRIVSIAMTVVTASICTAESFPDRSVTARAPAGRNRSAVNRLTTTSSAEDFDDVSVLFLRNDPKLTRSSIITTSAKSNRSTDGRMFGTEQLVSGHTEFSDDSAIDTSAAISSVESTVWHPLDTLTLFGGLEGSKQPQDFGVNANFGSRWAANWGIPLVAEYGIGAQIGTSINYTDNAVQVFERVGASTHRTQNFSTVGIFQRTDTWRWGIAYDLLYESYYDQFTVGQWRGRAGYATSELNEFGVWFTVPQQSSAGNFLNVPVQLSPMSQGSCYWQHQFLAGSRVMSWAGVAEGHAQANYALGDLKRTGPQFVFGAEIDIPLNAYFSIYGQANFIGPADTGTVDSFLGVTYYPGGRAFPASRSRFAPFQALANSTMFALDFRRR